MCGAIRTGQLSICIVQLLPQAPSVTILQPSIHLSNPATSVSLSQVSPTPHL